MLLFLVVLLGACVATNPQQRAANECAYISDKSSTNYSACISNKKKFYSSPNYKHNAYGLNRHSDQYGRPFRWVTQDGQVVNGRVKQHGYGHNVGMDQYGRPVKKRY